MLTLRSVIWLMLTLAFTGGSARAIPLDDEWLVDWDRALFQAKKQDRPIVLAFLADWDNNSRIMERNILLSEEFRLTFENWIRVRLDITYARGIAQKFGVRGAPTVIFINPAGDELERAEGYMTMADFMERHDLALDEENNLQGRIRKAMAGESDQKTVSELLRLLLIRNTMKQGLLLIDKLEQGAMEWDDMWLGELSFARAEFYYRNGEKEKTREETQAFLEKFPGHALTPKVLLKLAQTELALDDYDSAKKTLERLAKDYPGDPLAKTAQELLDVTLRGVDE